MGWLAKVFGSGIDAASVPTGPVTALPIGVTDFQRPDRVVVRFAYSPHPRHADDVAAVHRVLLRGWDDPAFRRAFVTEEISPSGSLCRRVPEKYALRVPVWVRDVPFPRSAVPPDVEEAFGVHPVWLRFDSPKDVSFDPPLADTPGGRARQRVARVRERKGVPVRAALVQANDALFQEGQDDLPGLVVFCTDGRAGDMELLDLADRVFGLRKLSPTDPDQAAVARLAADERFVCYGRDRLPRSFAGAREVYVGHLQFHRPFLTGGRLTDPLLDCLAEPGERGMLELIPQVPAAASAEPPPG